MRVLQIVHSPDPGGVLTLSRTIADGLSQHGARMEMVFIYQDTASGKLERLLGSLRIARLVLFGRHDALIAYQATASIIVGTVGWLRRGRVRIVHQTIQPDTTAAPIRLLDRVVGALGLYPTNVVNSFWTRSQFAAYPARYQRDLLLIEHGVQVPVVRRTRSQTWQDFGVPDDGPILLNTGRLAAQKNQAVLIHVLSGLPDARLVLVGTGPLRRSYEQLADQLGVRDRIHMLDAVAHEQIADLYAASDLFVFPSTHETFGISGVEAAQLGLQLVAADIPVLREVLTLDGQSEAIFVDPQDINSWTAAITAALTNPRPPARLLAYAQRMTERYSKSGMIRRYATLLGLPAEPRVGISAPDAALGR